MQSLTPIPRGGTDPNAVYFILSRAQLQCLRGEIDGLLARVNGPLVFDFSSCSME